MKLIALILISLTLCFSVKSEEINWEVTFEDDYEKTLLEELLDIKDLMVGMEDRLRDDRYDTTVQIKGKEIEDRLEKLEKEIEANEIKQKEENKKGKKPPKDSKKSNAKIGEVIVRKCSDLANKDYDNWAQLDSKIKRDKIIQSYAEEMPVRWRGRIAAYFLSIGEMENADEKLKKEIQYNEIMSKHKLNNEKSNPVKETTEEDNPDIEQPEQPTEPDQK